MTLRGVRSLGALFLVLSSPFMAAAQVPTITSASLADSLLTLTPFAGGAQAVSAQLVIVRIQ